MRYMGGKERQAPALATELERRRSPSQPYWEPFVGGASVISRMLPHGPRWGSDANYALICLYEAIQNGLELPDHYMTKAEWTRLRLEDNEYNPLTALAAFGFSFGGKWFGGYAKAVPGKSCSAAGVPYTHTSLLAKLGRCADVDWFWGEYLDFSPVGHLIYCDPPFDGTEPYAKTPEWRAGRFWAWAEAASAENDLLVSEYSAPPGWEVVWEQPRRGDRRNLGDLAKSASDTSGQQTERLYAYRG